MVTCTIPNLGKWRTGAFELLHPSGSDENWQD